MPEFDYEAHFRRFAEAVNDASRSRIDIDKRNGFFAHTCILVRPDGVQAVSPSDLPGLMDNPFGLPDGMDRSQIRLRSAAASALSPTSDRVSVVYAVEGQDGATRPDDLSLTYLVAKAGGQPCIFGILLDEVG